MENSFIVGVACDKKWELESLRGELESGCSLIEVYSCRVADSGVASQKFLSPISYHPTYRRSSFLWANAPFNSNRHHDRLKTKSKRVLHIRNQTKFSDEQRNTSNLKNNALSATYYAMINKSMIKFKNYINFCSC